MAFLQLCLASCVAVGLVTVFLLWKFLNHSKRRLPPSPPGAFLLGHLSLLAGKNAHVTLQNISGKLGGIISLRLGWIPAVVISSTEIAREVLQTHDLVFASRPYMAAGEYLGYNFKILGLSPYGEHWRNMKRLCTLQLFTKKRMDSFVSTRAAEVSFLLSAVSDENSKAGAVDLRKLITMFTFNVVTQILMGKRFFGAEEDDETRVFKSLILQVVDVGLQVHVSDFLPRWMRWVDWKIPGLKRLAARKDAFFQTIVDRHKSPSTFSQVEDFTSVLLRDCGGDEELIKATLQEMLSAGTFTTAATIEWAVAETIRHPRILERAQEQLDSVVGSQRMVMESDLVNLSYIQCIVKETFRRHPPAPLLVPHMSIQDCEVAGYDIPKGTTLFINAYAIGMDPSYWERPAEFLPERFLESKIDVTGHNFELLPFGSGRRSCPAMAMGLRTAHLAVANLIHAFNWSLDTPHIGTEKAPLWPEASLLKAVAVPRLTVKSSAL